MTSRTHTSHQCLFSFSFMTGGTYPLFSLPDSFLPPLSQSLPNLILRRRARAAGRLGRHRGQRARAPAGPCGGAEERGRGGRPVQRHHKLGRLACEAARSSGRRGRAPERRRGAGTRRPARAAVRRGGLERPRGGARLPCSELRRSSGRPRGCSGTGAGVGGRALGRDGGAQHRGGAAVEK